MNRAAGAVAGALLLVLGLRTTAYADDRDHDHVGVDADDSGLTTHFLHSFESTSPASAGTPGSDVHVDPVQEGTQAPVLSHELFNSFCTGVNWTAACEPQPADTAGPAPVQPQITQALVLRALRHVELPASELVVQPPGGETLVNFETNFYTRQGEMTRSVRLLGRRVDLDIWPSSFRWVFGDGETLAGQSAGSPYPDLDITHDYRSAGGVSPRVDTTYAARFRVDGGPWRDVDGTVTIPGQAEQLRVRTASPVLVGYE